MSYILFIKRSPKHLISEYLLPRRLLLLLLGSGLTCFYCLCLTNSTSTGRIYLARSAVLPSFTASWACCFMNWHQYFFGGLGRFLFLAVLMPRTGNGLFIVSPLIFTGFPLGTPEQRTHIGIKLGTVTFSGFIIFAIGTVLSFRDLWICAVYV